MVAIDVVGDPTFTKSATVLDDGSIVLPVLGRIVVAGLTIDQAQSRVTNILREYIRRPQVTVDVTHVGKEDVLVLGNVKTPGRYELRAGSLLTDAIAAAGGLGPVDGALPEARVGGAAGPTEQVSLQALLRRGDMSRDVPLAAGDVVYVPSATKIHVTVLGAVDHAGDVAINYGDPISMAVAKAGASSSSRADLSHVYLTRVLPDRVKHTYEINLYNALQGGDARYDVPLQQGDVIYVPKERRGGGFLWGTLLVLRRVVLGY